MKSLFRNILLGLFLGMATLGSSAEKELPSPEAVREVLFPRKGEDEARENRKKDSGPLRLGTLSYYLEKGEEYLELEEYNRARVQLAKALEKEPENLEALIGYGSSLEALGDRTEALEIFRRAARLHPEEPRPWLKIGNVLMPSSEKALQDEAREAYEKALSLAPEYHYALYNLALLDRKAGREEQALERLRQVLEQAPDFEAAHLQLGLLYRDYLQDLEKARHHFERYVEMDGGHKEKVKQMLKKLESGKSN